MKPSEQLDLHRATLRVLFKQHKKLSDLRVFGSVATGTDTEQSDIDFLVRADPKASLFDLGGLYSDLETLFGDNFDLLEESAIPEQYRSEILAEAVPV